MNDSFILLFYFQTVLVQILPTTNKVYSNLTSECIIVQVKLQFFPIVYQYWNQPLLQGILLKPGENKSFCKSNPTLIWAKLHKRRKTFGKLRCIFKVFVDKNEVRKLKVWQMTFKWYWHFTLEITFVSATKSSTEVIK